MWRWVWPQLALAVVVGTAWWALAPGGRSDSDQGYLPIAEAPGAQDSWIAVLSAGAGAVVALWWVARRPAPPDRASVAAITGALVGAALAGAAAAGLGLVIDLAAAGQPAATGPAVVTRLRLRAPAVVLLWPLALVLVVLVDTARDMVGVWLRRRWRRADAVS